MLPWVIIWKAVLMRSREWRLLRSAQEYGGFPKIERVRDLGCRIMRLNLSRMRSRTWSSEHFSGQIEAKIIASQEAIQTLMVNPDTILLVEIHNTQDTTNEMTAVQANHYPCNIILIVWPEQHPIAGWVVEIAVDDVQLDYRAPYDRLQEAMAVGSLRCRMPSLRSFINDVLVTTMVVACWPIASRDMNIVINTAVMSAKSVMIAKSADDETDGAVLLVEDFVCHGTFKTVWKGMITEERDSPDAYHNHHLSHSHGDALVNLGYRSASYRLAHFRASTDWQIQFPYSNPGNAIK